MKIVYIDRDGVINKFPGRYLYVTSLDGFEILPGVAVAIRKLKEAGYKTVVVSNQQGVSKGVYSQNVLDEITEKMKLELGKEGVLPDDIRYCVHLVEEDCDCRKPKTGNLSEIRGIDSEELSEAYFVGDAKSDIRTAKNAGIKGILVLSGRTTAEEIDTWDDIKPDFVVNDLLEAVEKVILK